mgnify:CR=1 FL=1
MKFSIVIPAYNYGHLLARAVSSACAQLGDDYEVLVIDDGSTDNTREVLAGLADIYAALRVISQDNRGLAAVRNRGIDESQGDYLIFLDADDELEPGALDAFRRAAVAHPAAGLLIAPTISVFEDGRVESGRRPQIAADAEGRFLDFLYKRLPISNGAVAMRRDVFSLVRYNPALRQTEDIPVFAHCLANFEAAAAEAPTTRIYKHAGSMRHDVDTALKLGMSLVEEVFDANRLPPALMCHRSRYQARRALSVFRLAYRSRNYAAAAEYFGLAWRADKKETLRQPKYVLRYLRCVIASF